MTIRTVMRGTVAVLAAAIVSSHAHRRSRFSVVGRTSGRPAKAETHALLHRIETRYRRNPSAESA